VCLEGVFEPRAETYVVRVRGHRSMERMPATSIRLPVAVGNTAVLVCARGRAPRRLSHSVVPELLR